MRLQGTRVHGDLNRTLTHSDPKVVSSYGKICTLAVLYQYSTCNLPVHSTCTLSVLYLYTLLVLYLNTMYTLPVLYLYTLLVLYLNTLYTLPVLYLYTIPEYRINYLYMFCYSSSFTCPVASDPIRVHSRARWVLTTQDQ